MRSVSPKKSSWSLFRRQGYTGAGPKAVVAEAGAPFGSLCHHVVRGRTARASALR